MQKFVNVFSFININKIGGVETFLYEIVKKYSKDYDITVLYKIGDPIQVNRLRKYVKCIQWNQQELFKCENIFSNYWNAIFDICEAKNYYTVIHADYKALGFSAPIHPKAKYICVSKVAQNSFRELSNFESYLCINPMIIEKPKKVLRLISATRLTREKGKHRIKLLADKLTDANIPFIWTIFTDDTKAIDNPNICYMKPKLDIRDYIADADYLVQLSDSEAWCYSINEALCLNTPVIVTDIPIVKELSIKNGINGYVLDLDLKNLDVNEIYNKIPNNFNYEYPKDDWEKYLLKSKSDYKPIIVEATAEYQKINAKDVELNKIPQPGEQWVTSADRALMLAGNNKYNKSFVIIKEGLYEDESV